MGISMKNDNLTTLFASVTENDATLNIFSSGTPFRINEKFPGEEFFSMCFCQDHNSSFLFRLQFASMLTQKAVDIFLFAANITRLRDFLIVNFTRTDEAVQRSMAIQRVSPAMASIMSDTETNTYVNIVKSRTLPATFELHLQGILFLMMKQWSITPTSKPSDYCGRTFFPDLSLSRTSTCQVIVDAVSDHGVTAVNSLIKHNRLLLPAVRNLFRNKEVVNNIDLDRAGGRCQKLAAIMDYRSLHIRILNRENNADFINFCQNSIGDPVDTVKKMAEYMFLFGAKYPKSKAFVIFSFPNMEDITYP
jgi:hypothetical protein